MRKLNSQFCVVEFHPAVAGTVWIYATCGMTSAENNHSLELHLFSEKKDDSIVELMTAIAHYHQTGAALDLGHTVNFGRPWQDASLCTYGLVSLPYHRGSELEIFHTAAHLEVVHCYWLIPITKQEREFKIQYGLEALEEKFEEAGLDYSNPARRSII